MKRLTYISFLCIALLLPFLAACDDDDNGSQSAPISVTRIYLEDADATVTDRAVDFARLGQLIRIEGSGFLGLRQIYVNGYKTYFNNALVTDQNIWVTLDSKTPVADANVDVRNTIRLVKDQAECVYEFTIRAASPQITSIDNTLPTVGEKVKVYGSSLHETTKVTLPGGVEITSGIENDPDGEWYAFTMPDGVTEGGSILSEGANGLAKTPACFNESRAYVIDFDNLGVMGSWSATYSADDLVDDPLNSGRGKVALLVPQTYLDEGGIQPNVGLHKYWATAGTGEPTDDWTRMTSVIPADTPLENVAIQLDVYFPEIWNGAGQLEISLINNLNSYGWGSGNTLPGNENVDAYAAVWVPWFVNEGVVPYKAEGWKTVTFPIGSIGDFNDGKAHTFQEVIDVRNNASNANFLFFLSNANIVLNEGAENEVVIKTTTFNQKIYVDNIRVVPYERFVVSDFPDDESVE